jgi:hypothetical protein
MSDRTFERAVREWLEEGSDRTPNPAIKAVLLAVKTTPQERAPSIPRRFTILPSYLRLAASLAIVAVLGIGGLVYLNSPGLGAPRPTTTTTATTTPTSAPTPERTEVAPGITAWTTFNSAIYSATYGYTSDWSVRATATRNWQDDAFPADEVPYADTIVGPGEGDAQIGLIVWQMHIDIFSGKGEDLTALADKFCTLVVRSSCDTFTEGAGRLDFKNGNSKGCAILVPTREQQFAFLSGNGCQITEATSWITVVVVTGEDDRASAVRYGGSVELLKSIITTMNVWRPGQQPGS